MKERREIGRYDQLPGVQIDERRIPASLRPLLPYARAWGILGDGELERAISAATWGDVIEAVEAARPLKEEIFQYAHRSAGAAATTVPDEVVLFQMFEWCLLRLESEVSVRAR